MRESPRRGVPWLICIHTSSQRRAWSPVRHTRITAQRSAPRESQRASPTVHSAPEPAAETHLAKARNIMSGDSQHSTEHAPRTGEIEQCEE